MSDPTLVATAQGALNATVIALGGAGYTMSATPGSLAQFQEINTGLAIAQRDAAVTFASAFDSQGQLATGSTLLGFDPTVSLFAEHPEIETWGFSFNTNISGHTVQGDFNYRPDMPLQIDTDVITINALFNACQFTTVGVFETAYDSMATLGNERGDIIPW